MNEKWLPAPGQEGRYEVSSFGRVRSLVLAKRGGVVRRVAPKVLTTQPNSHGYQRVCFGKTTKRVSVARLVLLAFSGEPVDSGMEAAHQDGLRTNNRLSNLRWMTPAENRRQRIEHGTMRPGSRRLLNQRVETQDRLRVLHDELNKLPTATLNLATHFWSKVTKTAGCWFWTGKRVARGYGQYRYSAKLTGVSALSRKTQGAHRVAWILTHGEIPSGVGVGHSCGNAGCVRPSHLFLKE